MESEYLRRREIEKERNRYFAVLDNGVIIESEKFDDIKILPEVKWMFRQYMVEYFETYTYHTPYSRVEYKCLDQHSIKRIFTIKDVKGYSFIEKLKGRAGFPGYDMCVECAISDTEGKTRKIELEVFTFYELYPQLIAIFEKLNTCKTWDIFDILEKNDSLIKENLNLKEEVGKLKEKIDNILNKQ